ncbi:membrane bound O-acyl transferase family-domain-containing protein [Mycena vulgaris]|nr:membrane bound O-acyl transferase family-domain-containing protein [Mycena vulgaris]
MAASIFWPSQLFDLSHRVPLNLAGFFHTFLPPVGLYYGTNVLAILGPKTFLYRLALLPVTLFVAYRATVSLDIARSFLAVENDHLNRLNKLDYMNQAMVLAMFTVFTRTLTRTFSSQTPRRIRGASQATVMTPKQLALDAADLTFNLRGYGWNISAGTKFPPHTRPLTPTSAFLVPTLKSLVAHVIFFDFLQYACQLFGPDTIGSTVGGSIYDMSITDPTILYLRSTAITLLVGLVIYGAIQMGYDTFSLIGVLIFRQSPAEWPPVFQSPWFATSLTEFWAVRWHQVFRQDFIAIGGKPLSLMAGRSGGVLGAFLVSGVLHYVGMWGMGKGSDIRFIFFFLMMGVGVVLEGLWKRVSGARVGGWMGWIWSVVWVLTFAHLLADPWCCSGLMGSVFLPQVVRPSVLLHRYISAKIIG